MRKVRVVMAWMLLFILLVSDVDLVSAARTFDTNGAVQIEEDLNSDSGENEEQVVDSEETESESSEISEPESNEVPETENTESEASSSEDISDENQETDNEEITLLDSGTISGVKWKIMSNGYCEISGEQKAGVKEVTPYWNHSSADIYSVKITAKNVTSTNGWFWFSKVVSVDLSEFDASTVIDMRDMFFTCEDLQEVVLGDIDTSNVTDMGRMFYDCKSLTSINLSALDTGSVTNMESMFSGCTNLLNLDLRSFDTSNVTSMDSMFLDCVSLESLDVSSFNTGKVKDMSHMFMCCSSLKELDVSGFDTSNVTTMTCMFHKCMSLTELDVTNFYTANVKEFIQMFQQCSGLTTLDVSGFDTRSVIRMGSMFSDCSSLTTLNVMGFDTSKVTTMSAMFQNCSSLTTLDITGFDTSKVTSMSGMFYGCSGLTTLDVTGFDTSNVTDMSWMFSGCSGLTILDVTGFDTSNVEYINSMFENCKALKSIDVSGFDTSKVIYLNNMFDGCKSLNVLDVSNFNIQNVRYLHLTFDDDNECRNLKAIKVFKGVEMERAPLPKPKMYDEFGNEYRFFPVGLEESIWLYTEDPSKTADVNATRSSLVMVYDEKTNRPLRNVNVLIEGKKYVTESDGSFVLDGNKVMYSKAIFTKQGYLNKETDIYLSSGLCCVYLEPDPMMQFEHSKVEADVNLENEVKFLGMDFKWLDLGYEIKLDFPLTNDNQKFPVKREYDPDTNTIKVSFGIKQKDGYAEEEYGDYYSIKETITHIESTKDYLLIVQYMRQLELYQKKAEVGVDVDSSIMGYYEVDASTGEVLESGAMVMLAGEGEITYYPTWGAKVVYLKGTIKIGATGNYILDFSDDNIEFKARLDLETEVEIAGGLGSSDAHLEVGAVGKFENQIDIPWKNVDESLKIKSNVKVYLEGKLFNLSETLEKELVDEQLWPRKSVGNGGSGGDGSWSLGEYDAPLATDEKKLMPRDYNTDFSTPNGKNYTVENVYPDPYVRMVTLEDGTMVAVWLADLGKKSSADRTTLVYSTNAGDGWAEAKAVCETERGDFYPSLAACGNKAFLVYSNIDTVLGDDVTLEEYAQHVDLYVSVFEGGQFGQPTILTQANNGKLEFNSRIYASDNRVAVTWIENSENDPYLLKGTNSIYLSTYKNGVWRKQLLENQLPMISSLAVSCVDGDVYVAYCIDEDNSIDTEEDKELYLWDGRRIMRITSDYKSDNFIQFVDNQIFWISGSEMMQMTVGDIETIKNIGISAASDYQILKQNGQYAIVYTVNNGLGSELYITREIDGEYSVPVPITDYGNRISYYAVAYNKEENLEAILFEKEIHEEEEGFFGQTNMHVTDELKAYDVIVNGAWYSLNGVTEENKLPIKIELGNLSSDVLDEVLVEIKSSNEVVYSDTVECNIVPNTNGEIEILYPMAECPLGQKVAIHVTPLDFEEHKPEDNSTEIILGKSDVRLDSFEIAYEGEEAILSGKIINNGYQNAENVSFTVLEGSKEGDAIYTVQCGNLAAGAEYDVSYIIPAEKIDFVDFSDTKYFHVVTDTDTLEEQYANNSENLAVFPVRATGLSINYKELELSVGATAQIEATVLPEKAINKEVYFVSNKHEVAVVLQDGTIIATSEGVAIISVITKDGAFVKECFVSVIPSEKEDMVYSLNTRWTTLNVGENEQLALFDSEQNPVLDLNWSSSNVNVATVDENGLVHACDTGTAYVEVSTADGAYRNVCVVQVISAELQALIFTNDTHEMTEGESLMIQPEFVPDNTTTEKKLQWTSSDSAVATVDGSGTVFAVNGGSATITATSVNGMSAQYRVIVKAQTRYSVTFDTGMGDENIVISDVLPGTRITLPDDPVRENYMFIGWFTEKDGKGEQFTGESVVDSNLNLYAGWTYIVITPEGIWIKDFEEPVYTGKEIKPQIEVYDGAVLLQPHTDYTISYKNNKNTYTYAEEDYQEYLEGNSAVAVGTFNPKKAPQVILKMKGNYSGSRTIYFRINPVELDAETIAAEDLTVTYTGKKQKPTPKVTWNGKALKYGTDFYVPEYDATKKDKKAFTEKGTYTLTLTGKKNFTGELPITLAISESVKQIAIDKVTVKGIKDMPYTGEQLKPAGFSVKYKNDVLTEEGGDYTISWGENIAVGTGTITFTGTGLDTDGDGITYIGSKVVKFKITGISMSKTMVTGVEKQYGYTGEAIEPVGVITYKSGKEASEITLQKDVHYALSYQKNLEKGTATIVYSGLAEGGYTGTKKVTFKIVSRNISDVTVDGTTLEQVQVAYVDESNLQDGIYNAPFMKGGAKPEVTVGINDILLTQGKDYTISYSNNKKVASATDKKAPTIIIKGKGNYSGTKKVSYAIVPKPLSNENGITVVAKDKAVSASKNGYRQSFKVYDADGNALGSTDYDTKNVTYTLIQTENEDGSMKEENIVLDKTSVVAADSVILITVSGKGNYAGGEATGTYRILETGHDINKATIKIKNQEYTGNPVVITNQEQFTEGKVYLKVGKETRVLELGKDIEVVPGSYVKNVNKGTAKVTFRGIGDFGGTKTVSYKIGARSINEIWQGIFSKFSDWFNADVAEMN